MADYYLDGDFCEKCHGYLGYDDPTDEDAPLECLLCGWRPSDGETEEA